VRVRVRVRVRVTVTVTVRVTVRVRAWWRRVPLALALTLTSWNLRPSTEGEKEEGLVAQRPRARPSWYVPGPGLLCRSGDPGPSFGLTCGTAGDGFGFGLGLRRLGLDTGGLIEEVGGPVAVSGTLRTGSSPRWYTLRSKPAR